jgi:hypothetical protein
MTNICRGASIALLACAMAGAGCSGRADVSPVPGDARSDASLQEAALAGDVSAMNRLSERHALRKEFGAETDWIRRAAARDDALATYRLSDACFRGDRAGVEHSNWKGYTLLARAAVLFIRERLGTSGRGRIPTSDR